MIKIKRGLDLPITGAPEQKLGESKSVRTVAVLGRDYVGMKPTMTVQVGDRVRLGEVLFSDKKTDGIVYTSPGAGVVKEINRGARRLFLSVVVELDEPAADGQEAAVEFPRFERSDILSAEREKIVENLVNSGLWTTLRTRPYSKVPAPDAIPRAIFVNAMDTNPLAASPELIAGQSSEHSADDFLSGINILARLSAGKLHLCRAAGSFAGIEEQGLADNVQVSSFSGPHPAGLSGTHIHFLDPAGPERQVWSINYQDAMAIGQLFRTGILPTERVIALAGPQVSRPRLITTRVGASTDELVAGELEEGDNRIVSGSVLAGRAAYGSEAYLGRHHLQISVLKEGRERTFLGYLSPGISRHSSLGIYLSGLLKNPKIRFTTNAQGSDRAMVPVGTYETVMPLDILPTPLLRSLIVGDIETAVNLGALELDEEDLALCSYVCPGKYEYAPILRNNLTRIEKET